MVPSSVMSRLCCSPNTSWGGGRKYRTKKDGWGGESQRQATQERQQQPRAPARVLLFWRRLRLLRWKGQPCRVAAELQAQQRELGVPVGGLCVATCCLSREGGIPGSPLLPSESAAILFTNLAAAIFFFPTRHRFTFLGTKPFSFSKTGHQFLRTAKERKCQVSVLKTRMPLSLLNSRWRCPSSSRTAPGYAGSRQL